MSLMKKQLYIIGAGSVGCHVAWNAADYGIEDRLVGFLDDDPEKHGQTIAGLPVLGAVDRILEEARAEIVLGIAFPEMKERLFEQIRGHAGLSFPALVSSRAWICDGIELGQGALVYPGAQINYGCQIGAFAVINMNCSIGHDCKIASFSSLAPGVSLGGHTVLGERVEMGINSCTIQGIQVGDGSVVGAGAALVRDVPPGCVAVGVPGRVLGALGGERRG